MAKMTGPALLTYIREPAFIRTDKNTELYEAITDTLINMRFRFGFEEFAVEAYTGGISALGEYYFGVPSNFNHLLTDIRILDDTSSYTLTKRSKATFERMYPNPNASDINKSKPVSFCIYGNRIYLGPVPDSTDYEYEFSYSEEDADTIDADTTEVDFTARSRETVKYGSLFRVFALLDHDDAAMKWKALYEESIGLIIARDAKNTYVQGNVKYTDF